LSRILLGGVLAVFASHNCVAQTITFPEGVDWEAVVPFVLGDQVFDNSADSSSLYSSANESGVSSDKSSAASAYTCTFKGARIEAQGAIAIKPGVDLNGDVSQLTGAGLSLYTVFTIDQDAHYEFSSSCSNQGGQELIEDFVTFGTSTIVGRGASTMSGTLAKGSLTLLQAGCDAEEAVGPGSATFSFTLQLTPTNIPWRFTARQKASFLASSAADLANAKTLFLYFLSTVTAGEASPLLVAAVATDSQANQDLDEALDPVDTNYTVLAQAVATPVSPLSAGGGITQPAAGAFNAWLTNLSQSAGFSSALDTSINRAQGAAAASNVYWDNAQMTAAVQFETQLAAVLDQEPALRSNVVAQFEAAGFSIDVTTNDVLNLQAEITTNGLPTQLLDGLIQLGTDSDTITNIQFELLTADPTSIAGSFPQTLVNTNLDACQYATASSLRDAALTLINAAVLPTGQLRFDLPTEPGYTYTIQFNQDVSNPAGWAPIFSTNATSALLSYTNIPTAGQPAGFFRATHN